MLNSDLGELAPRWPEYAAMAERLGIVAVAAPPMRNAVKLGGSICTTRESKAGSAERSPQCGFVLMLNLVMIAALVIAGLAAHSLALVSDRGDFLR